MISNLDKKIRAYSLKNAIAHEGKAQTGAVISSLFHEGLKKEQVKDTIKQINQTIKEINSIPLPAQIEEYEKLEKVVSEREERHGLPEIPNTKKIITRFAPSPSGPLHIGHASTGSLSALYVKKYKGKFYIRIEDTNPENIYIPAYKMISEESKWLWGKNTKVIIQSDRMNLYYKYIKTLFNKNSIYVCTCDTEEFKKLIENQKPCPCRKNTIKENLEQWSKMLSKDKKTQFKEGEAVVRFKSNLKDPNPALRDFPLARINESPHPRQKKKYRVWPLMNLAVAVDDIETKVTHAIRASDHRDNSIRQMMIFQVLNKKAPWNAFVGRYNFTDLELSSTQMRKDIESGKYKSWSDPELPTIASLRKQGYKPEAFWGLAVRSGLTEANKTLTKKEYFELLDYFNRQDKIEI
ncbi:MAG: glutamate--tRNA ligase family protein [Nanoarchaeota archaeon]